MGKKKIIFRVIIVILILVVGFYPVIEKQVTSKFYISTSNKLKVYLLDGDGASLSLMTQYRNMFLDTEVEEVTFNTEEELYTRMSNDALAGDGPDVIFGNGASLKRVTKLLDSGIFLDLNPIIDQDNTFFLEDYNKKVMEAGVYDNKRLFLPVTYNVDSIITTKSILDYCKINNLDGSENLEGIIDASSDYLNNKNNVKDRIFCEQISSFTDFLDSYGIEAVDYRGKKANFDNQRVIDCIEKYKNIYLRNTGIDKKSDLSFLDANNELLDKKVIFSYFAIGSGYRSFQYSRMKSVMKEEPIIFPAYNNGIAKIGTFMAINSNTKNIDGAYKLIRVALSYQAQIGNIYGGIPVNNKAYQQIQMDGKQLIGYDTIKNEALPDNLEKEAENAATNFDKVILEDATVDELVNEEIMLYINGKKTAKTAAEDMQNKITLYLNE